MMPNVAVWWQAWPKRPQFESLRTYPLISEKVLDSLDSFDRWIDGKMDRWMNELMDDCIDG